MSRLLNHLIETATQARPDVEALAYRGVHLSYGELQQSIEATAAGVKGLGLKPGAWVAEVLPACKELRHLVTVEAELEPGLFPHLTLTDWKTLQSSGGPVPQAEVIQ